MHVLEAHTTQLKRGDSGVDSTTQLMQADPGLREAVPAAFLSNVADSEAPLSSAMHLEGLETASSSPDSAARALDKQDRQPSRDLLTEAAQPILYPVMPLQTALQGGQEPVQLKVGDSLPSKAGPGVIEPVSEQAMAVDHRAQTSQQPFSSLAGEFSPSGQQVSQQEEATSQPSSPSRCAANDVICQLKCCKIDMEHD